MSRGLSEGEGASGERETSAEDRRLLRLAMQVWFLRFLVAALKFGVIDEIYARPG